jgi:two-component system, HptB-dependent secretion and biofilm response regulator
MEAIIMNDVRRLKILVADDTDTDRLILESIVRKEGHHVVSACNGLEAIQVYSVEKPDIVLLDALMPELDGFGAARKIKELAGDELVPIIFLTSLSDTESLVQCLDAGGDDFLSKPLQPYYPASQNKILQPHARNAQHYADAAQPNRAVQ